MIIIPTRILQETKHRFVFQMIVKLNNIDLKIKNHLAHIREFHQLDVHGRKECEGLIVNRTTAKLQGYIIYTLLKSSQKSKNFNYNEILQCRNGNFGEEKFIISAKWWQTWWDYVNFESRFEDKISSGRSSENKSEIIIEGRISKLEEKANKFGKIWSENDSTIYNRPGKIINSSLISPDSFNKYKYELKENLQEFYDYIVINSSAWKYISSWYNYDFEISKELGKKFSDSISCSLNIYPENYEYPVEIKKNPEFYLNS